MGVETKNILVLYFCLKNESAGLAAFNLSDKIENWLERRVDDYLSHSYIKLSKKYGPAIKISSILFTKILKILFFLVFKVGSM